MLIIHVFQWNRKSKRPRVPIGHHSLLISNYSYPGNLTGRWNYISGCVKVYEPGTRY